MTKIYLDNIGIKNNSIQDNLSLAITHLTNAKSIASELKVPSGFYYYTYTTELDTKINSILSEVSNITNIIESDSNQYSLINDELKDSVSAIENYSVSLRQSAIK